MNVKYPIKYFITALFAFVISIFVSGQVFLSAYLSPYTVYAGTETAYSDVLDDLHNNANFNKNNYPNVNNNYTLELITIAESVNNELFVYVYQPSDGYAPTDTYKASSITMSTATGESLDYKNYSLEYLNNSGVFYKYKVKSFTVGGTIKRIYEISDILRPFSEQLGDKKTDNDNTVSEVTFKVAKQFQFERGSTGESKLSVEDIETIQITDKFVGFLRYPGGSIILPFYGNSAYADYHFIAFSTDYNIADLLEVRVFYNYVGITMSVDNEGIINNSLWYNPCSCGDGLFVSHKNCNPIIKTDDINLKAGDMLDYTGKGWFYKDYNFPVIEKTEDFLKSSDLNYSYEFTGLTLTEDIKLKDTSKDTINKQQWVVRFLLTDYSIEYLSLGFSVHSWTRISDVKILQLRFFDEVGTEYNLGVVDNKQSGSTTPDNEIDVTIELNNEFERLFKLILGIAALIILWPFISPILVSIIKLIFKGIVLIIKWIFKILTLPFKLIFKKRRRKR